MSSEEVGKGRILVGIGGSDIPEQMMRVAGKLAAAMNAELCGLFVEEEYLFDLSRLPFAKTVGTGGNAPQALTEQLMDEAMRRQANLFRRALAEIAQKSNLRWTFDRARGRAQSALMAIARKQDIVVLQATSTEFTVKDMILAGRQVAGAVSGIVVFGQRARRISGPVVAIDDGDEMGLRTLHFAKQIAKSMDAPVHVLIIAASEEEAARIEGRAAAELEEVKLAGFRRLLSSGADELEAALQDLRPCFVVADLEGEPFSDNEAASAIIRAAGAPVLLIRPERSI
jgi:K+-sensing histidine kinase KdpD